MKAVLVIDRPGGKHILTLMSYLPVEDIRKVWSEMSKGDRAKFFGGGHAEELDQFIKSLGKSSTDHLAGDPFGAQLHSLHSGEGMSDHHAASVLHDASGVRLARRAVSLPPGTDAHRSTLGILNARYKESQKRALSSGPSPHQSGEDPGSSRSNHPSYRGSESDESGGSPADAGDGAGSGQSADEQHPGAGDTGGAGSNGEGERDKGVGATGAAVRKVTGSADIPLSEDGEDQIREMSKRVVKAPFDVVLCAPSDRSRETASYFSDDPVEIPALDGWARGELEGQPVEKVKAEVRKLILNPDLKPVGKSPESGKPGESYNEFMRPLLETAEAVESVKAPRVLTVTSGGNLQLIDAWDRAGAPKDFRFSLAGIAAHPYWSVTGKLFRRVRGEGLAEVQDNLEEGRYFMEHGETEWNSKERR